jgi:predicted nuclease of predicted toxin-antitoxin system
MKLLLDVHIPAATADALRRRQPGLDVQHLAKWKHGDLLEAEDADVLAGCAKRDAVG